MEDVLRRSRKLGRRRRGGSAHFAKRTALSPRSPSTAPTISRNTRCEHLILARVLNVIPRGINSTKANAKRPISPGIEYCRQSKANPTKIEIFFENIFTGANARYRLKIQTPECEKSIRGKSNPNLDFKLHSEKDNLDSKLSKFSLRPADPPF